MNRRIRVLVVDDQAIVREMISRGLETDPDFEVVGKAPDPYVARDMIVELAPDVLTLDVEMPRMNGVEFLRRLMPQYPIPVVMVSSLTKAGREITLQALEAGAVDFVSKPTGEAGALESMLVELRTKVRAAASVDVRHWAGKARSKSAASKLPLHPSAIEVIVIGASTGGTNAIRDVIMALPAQTPGIVVVQHMPAGFTQSFAARLNEQVGMEVKEAERGDMITAGRVLIAPGDFQLAIQPYGAAYKANVFVYDKVQGHRPSVDVLFTSVAESQLGPRAIGVLLTGMGKDGAQGLLQMRKSGCRTIGQNEKTSVVYGMPRVANEMGAVEFEENLFDIPQRIGEILRSTPR